MIRKRFFILLLSSFFVWNTLDAQSVTPAISSKTNSKTTKEEILIRRKMLDFHQLSGFITLGLWLATNLEGEKAKDSLYRKSDEYAKILLLTRPEYSNNDPLYSVSLFQGLDQNSIAATYFLFKDPANNFPLYFALKSNEEWEAKHSGSFSQTISIFYFWNVSSNCWFSFFCSSKSCRFGRFGCKYL
ncbi:hypothetical protein LEP1GSC116_5164 [Leptospira interrogans serovar Icterohaemorrhagiae str. Verdun HP]|uniref:Uncharacterized protein n=1 Tax=Leptospira interrogans serovar Icterohaemorrhagiae str. Verdun HP TaxID=1049910 RepID=M6RBK4_LEPIR|nr:hypothetical protein LEP1GSC116_5164 [Leptospira interrogans serovar Icterohaemorrhagiae str. Verdun HP]